MKKLNLNGPWLFAQSGTNTLHLATVPGCVHTDLLKNKLIDDPFREDNELKLEWIEHTDWEYRRNFKISPSILKQEHVELVLEGIDTVASVSLNGNIIGHTENMFVEYRFDIKEYLLPGNNEITISFLNPMNYINEKRKSHSFDELNDPVGGASNIRKQQSSFGWDWGPRFPTCGIYKPVYIQAWSANRIESVLVKQFHEPGNVKLSISPDICSPADNTITFRCRASLDNSPVAYSDNLELIIENPRLWWPNGLGSQPLYEITVEMIHQNRVIDSKQIKIGLRTITLDQENDQWGHSFRFIINNKPVFAKGANWIPADSFVSRVTPAVYGDLLNSAAEANMNMLRVWGGGIYETDIFYELCDKLGILVWQDFMFACALYPGDSHFQSLVRQEASFQIKRLRNHACLSLWCGNNEIEQMPAQILFNPLRKIAYEELFYHILPGLVSTLSPGTPYWPSSPHNPGGYGSAINSEHGGDAHFWDVWHGRKSVKAYEEKAFRFYSEFGMQSYCSPQTAKMFTSESNPNIFGPCMENHQKHPAGNMIMMEYISRLYRFPRDYQSLSYLSQLNQAYCMRVAVEHFRRNMPRTMGALYWQLNDCWPVASWSSIEYGGRWKALHFHAKRFFAPALICAHVHGDEFPGKGNRMINTISRIDLYTVSDLPSAAQARAGWTLYHNDSGIISHNDADITLAYGESVMRKSVDFSKQIEEHGRRNLYLRIFLENKEEILSQNTVFFTAPRFMNFKKEKIDFQIGEIENSTFSITFTSKRFHHQVAFDLRGIIYRASDNYFDLYPDIPHTVTVRVHKSTDPAKTGGKLTVRSLVDSY